MPIATDKAWLKNRNKYMSGFCNDIGKPGQHEGQRPKSGGVPLITCPFWSTCPCECHYEIDQMFQMTGMERREALCNPEYKVDRGDFVLPEVSAPNYEIQFSHSTASVQVDTPATPTGRRHRGQLEHEVLSICKRWLAGELGWEFCQPKFIAELMATEFGIATPSTGAIQAVWIRWEKLGIASQEKKPIRFTGWDNGFSGEVSELERIKAARKRQSKHPVARLAR